MHQTKKISAQEQEKDRNDIKKRDQEVDDVFVIASLLNVSNKEFLTADSGFITQNLFGQELVRRGHDFVLIGPFKRSISFPTWYLDFGDTKYAVRFGFDYLRFRKIIREILDKYKALDWVWVNQPEIAVNVRMVLDELGLHDTRILVYVHYLPVLEYSDRDWSKDPSLDDGGMVQTIMRHIAEGCTIADAVGIHAGFGKDLLCNVSEWIGMHIGAHKVHVIPTATDPYLIAPASEIEARIKDKASRKVNGMLYFGYANRLYTHYGTEEMFDYFGQACNRFNARVWVTNPTGNRSRARRSLDLASQSTEQRVLAQENVISFGKVLPRDEYKDWLSRSDFVFGPNRKAALWSLSLIDGMGMGVPSLAPNAGAFSEMLPVPCLWNDLDDLDCKIKALIEDEDLYFNIASECHRRAIQFLPVNQVTSLERILKEVNNEYASKDISRGAVVVP